MLASFPVMVFAYTCHQNVKFSFFQIVVRDICMIQTLTFTLQMFSVLNEINNNSHFQTTGVIIASIGTACMTYVLVGITGYLSFGDNIKGNIVSMCMLRLSLLTVPRDYTVGEEDMLTSNRRPICDLHYRPCRYCHPCHVLLPFTSPPLPCLH